MKVDKLIRVVASLVVALLLMVALSNAWIIETTKGDIYYTIDALPIKNVALVLGTSDKLMTGENNPFFQTRINMAADLYKSGKVKHLLLSGDNRSKYYNEPQKMKNALTAMGIPDEAITLDHAGLRTLDSIVRCKIIFGQDNVVIVTQAFHCHRALFLSNYYGVNAVGMATESVPKSIAFKTVLREIFARTIAIWDTYIMNATPAYLGEKEIIDTIK